MRVALGETQRPSTIMNDKEIRKLVVTLIAAKATFDPVECLDGRLFVLTVIQGPTPLWGDKRKLLLG